MVEQDTRVLCIVILLAIIVLLNIGATYKVAELVILLEVFPKLTTFNSFSCL
jgi:hypothetical protein